MGNGEEKEHGERTLHVHTSVGLPTVGCKLCQTGCCRLQGSRVGDKAELRGSPMPPTHSLHAV